jgi:hypothetical protein
MVGVSRLLVALAVSGLLTSPLYADVIPTRRAGDTTDSSKKVESRLVQLGVSAEAAKDQVKNLSDDQTRYSPPTPSAFSSSARRTGAASPTTCGGSGCSASWLWGCSRVNRHRSG